MAAGWGRTREGRLPPATFAAIVLTGLAIVFTAWFLVTAWLETGRVGWDTFTYLAAGERLNAGHALYALGPGDRWIWINPPYWTVPLFYPPTIAVLWQPLAALPSETGVAIWVFANGVALVGSIGFIIVRGGWRPALMAAILAPTIAFEMKVGNIHGFLMASMVLVYLRPRLGALAIGLLTAVKLTPAVILIWLFANGRRREAVTGAAFGAIALGGAIIYVGIDQVLVYVDAVRDSAPSVISVPGLLGTLGVPGARLVAYGLTAALVLAVVHLRGRPASWVVAVLAMVIGSPVVNIPTLLIPIAIWLPYPRQAVRARELERTEPRPSAAAGSPG